MAAGSAQDSPGGGASPPGERAGSLRERLRAVRQRSEALIAGLEAEDLVLQGMADASPPKWHLGHTAWFFEAFLLQPLGQSLGLAYGAAEPLWGYLFNSYYDAVGERHPRPQRGLLSRPPIRAVLAWRERVSAGLEDLLDRLECLGPAEASAHLALLELGLQHEQQHQELLLMDLLDGFSRNPLEPAYSTAADGPEALFEARWRQEAVCGQAPAATGRGGPAGWIEHPGGLVSIGHPGGMPTGEAAETALAPFHFDNEAPRHRVWLEPFAIAESLVTNADYASFIAAGGYRRPELWMSEGWAVVQQHGWQAPRYWRGDDAFTLAGRLPRQADAPVRHLSWFEADAYARWAGARLPSEAEWETAAGAGLLRQAHGVLWQWTGSPYRPYPGFQAAAGAVGEYNGKFMSSQLVLRGSCFLTPEEHAGIARRTYRNFFPPASRWMASGLRLAHDRG
jgi:ergothioneine biosynthesis protein EgtB